MKILAIDTSCDETSVAVTNGAEVLSNVISSQVKQHAKFGGVVPMLAARLHEGRIEKVADLALQRAGLTWSGIDGLAVTYGPGLAPALQVGIAFAKSKSQALNLPLWAVNHMAGHLASVLAVTPGKPVKPFNYPLLALLVSGGHTELVVVESWGQFKIIGQTLDDAVGEAYDKVAKLLGLGYPGGKVLADLAKLGDPYKYDLPVPMHRHKEMNFSYSGLKNAVRLLVEGLGPVLSKQQLLDVAAGFERVAQQHLLEKVGLALDLYPETQGLVAAGGVVANKRLRSRLRKIAHQHGLPIHFPASSKLCTDNAAMIGVAAWLDRQVGKEPADLSRLDRVPDLSLDKNDFTSHL